MTNSSTELDRAPASVGPPGSRAAALAAAGYPVTMSLAILTCAVAPAYIVRWHLGPLPTTLLENALLLTIAAFVIESWRAGTLPAWRTSLTVPAALFLIAGAISVIVAPDRRAAVTRPSPQEGSLHHSAKRFLPGGGRVGGPRFSSGV